jgi:polysaccharide deacetylase family protein (PEP-CTERM system associated)
MTPSPAKAGPLNAFCVDLEEWFHAFGIAGRYADPANWDDAPVSVVKDTEDLMRLLDDAGTRGTFLTVGWVARKYPDLIRRLAREGHEVGCHSYWHRLVFQMKPEEFDSDLAECLGLLRDLTGQPVDTFRAPGFSVTAGALWAYPLMRSHGITTDISIVPARRDHGGIAGFPRDAFTMSTEAGDVVCFPVSVMTIAGKAIPFSGGGYLRLFPYWLVEAGFAQNHEAGRPGMSYIHPREVNPNQPRLPRPSIWKLPALLKYAKYYVNLDSTRRKLARLLEDYRFGTVADVLRESPPSAAYTLVKSDARQGQGAYALQPCGQRVADGLARPISRPSQGAAAGELED